MILDHFTDNDLYKFTTMNAIQKLYPEAMVRYSFIDRGETKFPDGFAVQCGFIRDITGIVQNRLNPGQLFICEEGLHLAPDAAYMIRVAFVVTEYVSAVEHHYPGAIGIGCKCR